MKASPKISIITPVYNAENYLFKCLNSIVAQSFLDWELILVDDGSTDNSAAICDDFAAIDNRIRVFHTLNLGVSAARQTGLCNSRGEYIIHVDSDDWVEVDMLENLYVAAVEENADVVICDYFTNDGNNQIYVQQKPNSLVPMNVLRELFQHLHGSCWNKLVKRSILMQYSISFPIGLNYCEDIIIWLQLFQHSEIKISYHPSAYYHYVVHKLSITNRYTIDTYKMRLKYLDYLVSLLPVRGFEYEFQKNKLQVIFEGCMFGILSMNEARCEIWNNRRIMFIVNHNLKWKIGFAFILLGFYSLGRKFLKY